jgi:catechol 2,3-dioxygenase-like lactoylglutathione lyase family enzyme
MQITEIAFSSYPVTDIPRARAFYEGVLKLKVTSETNMGEQGHWVEYEIGPGALGIGRAPWLETHAGWMHCRARGR